MLNFSSAIVQYVNLIKKHVLPNLDPQEMIDVNVFLYDEHLCVIDVFSFKSFMLGNTPLLEDYIQKRLKLFEASGYLISYQGWCSATQLTGKMSQEELAGIKKEDSLMITCGDCDGTSFTIMRLIKSDDGRVIDFVPLPDNFTVSGIGAFSDLLVSKPRMMN